MPVNVSPEYAHAEKAHLDAKTIDEKIETLQKLISCAPSHKGGENLRAQLRLRLKNLQQKLEKSKKSRKSTKQGIKKQDMQAILIGFSNSGKSNLISELTKTSLTYNKQSPRIRMMNYLDTQVQLISNPSIDSKNYDKGLTNSTDTVLIIVDKTEDIEKILNLISSTNNQKIIVFTKIDLLSENEKRKINSYLQSKKYNFATVSSYTKEGFDELKEKLFKSFNKIRVYTKEPGKEKSHNPIILEPNSTVEKVAEKILKGFSKKVVETKIWGPSSKFSGQIVGLKHELKDGDIVEFKTK